MEIKAKHQIYGTLLKLFGEKYRSKISKLILHLWKVKKEEQLNQGK